MYIVADIIFNIYFFAYLDYLVAPLTASLQRGKNLPTNVRVFDTKQSDCEVPVLLELWGNEYPFIAIAPRSSLTRSGST